MVKDYEKGSYKEYDLTEDYLNFIGRSATVNDMLCFSNSGSGLEFICKGDYAEITICSGNDYVYSNHQPRIAIYADGNLIVDECVSYGEKTYRVDTKYSGTKIKLVKLSEAMFSSFYVSKVASYSIEDIEPSAEKELKIEFIGDSITCGYGIDGGRYTAFSTATENFSKSYAYLTAEKLNAECSAVCFSGYGVFTGYTEGYTNDKVVMNEYDKACYLSVGEDILWDFSKNTNNLIVVNLGTNDASYCSGSYSGRQKFIEAYGEMLETLRDKNPEAFILCILGDMNNSLYPSIETAVSLYTEKTDDNRVEAFAVDFRMGENDIVVDGHPGEKSNICASEILASKINSLIQSGAIN